MLAATCALALGFGGVDFGMPLINYEIEARRLSELNHEWGGMSSFGRGTPIFFIGGHGGGHVGPVTIGGRGAVGLRQRVGDAVRSDFGAVEAAFDLGWHWAPIPYLAVRPGIEAVAVAYVHYVHDRETPFFDPDFGEVYIGATGGVMPAVEVMGRLPHGMDNYVGLFAHVGWLFPVYGPDWYYGADPPRLDLRGIHLQLGIRFGKLPPQSMRI